MQVAKIKSDEREDLKVLATGVAAALAARKVKFTVDSNVNFLCSRSRRSCISQKVAFPYFCQKTLSLVLNLC